MSDAFRPIEPGFSVTDAEYPNFELGNGHLTLSFTDWHEKPVRVLFKDVVAVKWQELELMRDGDGIEGIYVIDDSSWLAHHVPTRAMHSEQEYKHFRFDFNACGSLEVVCISFEELRA
jgi:hypothetical protein